MQSLPLSEAKDRLSMLVEQAQTTHEIVTITKHGRPAAVLMAAEDLDSLQETLHWLSQPGLQRDLLTAAQDVSTGDTRTSVELRAELDTHSA